MPRETFWKERNVLLTGYAGFVGSWLGKKLLDLGANLTVITRDIHSHVQPEKKPQNEIFGDLTDFLLVNRVMNEYQIEICFHLAAQAIVGSANASPISTFDSNIKGTWNILESARLSPFMKSVIVASSDKCYGEPKFLPITEEHPLLASNPYDVSKACADMICQSYFEVYGLNVSVTRCSNIYGGGDMNFSRIVPSVIKALSEDKRPILRSSGNSIRDYVYIKDIINGYLLIGENAGRKDVSGEAFNFGTNRPTTVLEIVNLLCKLANKMDLKPIVGTDPIGEIRKQYLSSDKAIERLGWKAEIDLEKGLKETLFWYSNWFSEAAK